MMRRILRFTAIALCVAAAAAPAPAAADSGPCPYPIQIDGQTCALYGSNGCAACKYLCDDTRPYVYYNACET